MLELEDVSSQDKSTVISLLPWPVKDKKPAIYPGEFLIPAAEKGDISLIIVGQSVFFITMEGRSIKSTTPSIQMARSICVDYINDSLDVAEGAYPGLIYTFGEYTKEEAKKKLALQIAEAEARQRRWFEKLVKDADDNWNLNHQFKAISDLHRKAAIYLGQEREWTKSFAQMAMTKCPVCQSLVDPKALQCGNCQNVLKPEEYKKVFQSAQTVLAGK